MNEKTFQNIKGSELPDELAKRLGIAPDDLVDIAVHRPDASHHASEFDRKKIERIVAELQQLPILDERSPDEILGYDENGLPT